MHYGKFRLLVSSIVNFMDSLKQQQPVQPSSPSATWYCRAVDLRLTALIVCLFAGIFSYGCRGGEADVFEPIEGARYSIIAVGDTGRTHHLAQLLGGQIAVSEAMMAEAQQSPVNALIFLGDYFYWNGLDRETLVSRVRENLVAPYCYFLRLDGPRSSEVEEACRIPRRDRAPVPIFAVLGNHDLILPESSKLEREAVPLFVPDWQMSSGLTQVFELGDGISLILFESEVAIDDESAIRRSIKRAIHEAQGPWRILAMHRPISTNDLGERKLGGYPGYVRKAIESSGLPVQLTLAGHHHSLQVFETAAPLPALHVGAGSGSKASGPLAQNHPDVRFSRMRLGFARIDLIGNGQDERLSVTLTETNEYPILSLLDPPRRVARFEVDQQGRVFAP